ncbi:hypothetical protein HY988_05600 [Candidatus Micrarchaeota archaeon]|nr:hypothetical protein [Candidatus Micrarchaeota archaeon]
MKSFDKYENKKAQCFMVVCRSRITENIIKITGEFLLSVKNINEMGREMAHFPLMWVIEPESLERLGRLIKSITSNRIINAIMQNPQWVENDRNFAKLAELVAELEKSAKAGILSDTLVEAIGELDIDRSIALARRINERPEYLEVYTKFGVKARKLRMTSVEFYEYVMDVADQQVSQTETFHSVFQRAFAGRTDQIPIRVCRSAALIYLAGILPELATITESSEKDNEKLVDQIMEAVENGEFEIASRILNQRKIEMQARAEMAALERVMRFYPQATNEQVAAFLPLFKRLEVFGLTKKFTGLRKHGYEQARIIAEKTALLNDGALVTIFKSVPARALFVELALKIGGEETYERVNAIACEGSNGESELGMLRYMRAVVDQEKTAVTKESRRIVLVGGNNELDEIAHRLSEKTGLEVFPVTPSDATMSYLGRLITKNDIIIFITSSVKHASFRNVNAVANRKGISPINTARTNPDAILREIGHLMGEVLEARSVA